MRNGWFLLGMVIGLALSFPHEGVGQTLDLSGPSQMGRCEQEVFTIALSNDTPQTFSNLIVTFRRGNADFLYVTGSSILTLPDGSSIPGDPQEVGLEFVWDIDAILGEEYELPPGETLVIRFSLATTCTTLSGTHEAWATGDGFLASPYDALSVEILPGAVRIYKTPGVIDAHVGDVVTWTIVVENTGLGAIHQVVVTDTLGSGLAYVSATPPGTPSGQQVVWELGTIPAGEQVELRIQAQVVACEGLDNRADVRFGCEDGSICYDTAVQGGTATASLHLLVDNPLLDFPAPNILLPYCNVLGTTVTVPIVNNGPGPAKNVRICVNFPNTLQVQNVQGGATWDGSCFHLPDIPAGGSFDLVFDLLYTGDWCTAIPAGNLFWQASYENVCGDEFRPPAVFGAYGTSYDSAGPPTLSVSLQGEDQVYICTEPAYSLAVTFSGLGSCGGGTTSDITVEVTVPPGFVVTDPGGGTWIPGGDGTGGTILYETPPDVPLITAFSLRAPGAVRCGQVATLTVTATATNCCGCALSAATSIPVAIECYQLVASTRQASTNIQEKCGAIVYTNTYEFADDPALDEISFDELVFIEDAANNQDYVEGTLSITIDGAPASPVTMVDNTPGGTFEIRGIDDSRPVRGHTLVISYELAFTPSSLPTACPSSYPFYSWSTLNLGPDCRTGNECTEPCQYAEVLRLTSTTPSMSVSITGLPGDFVDPCGTYGVTLTLTKTSDFDPYNVRLQLESLNYYIVELSSITCSGVCPSSLIPTDYGTYYEWDYDNAFVGQPYGAQSILQFQVRKRCNPGRALVATALFQDSCGYSSCVVSDYDMPSVMREPLLYVYKTPEVIYATQNLVTWTIYVTHGGAGPAYEVWVDDLLGTGLVYEASVVDPDVIVSPGQDHTGMPMNGVSFWIPVIAPGGTRQIQITARMVACQDLTDRVWVGQSCGDAECVPPISDSSYVLIPSTSIVATAVTRSPMETCSENEARITIRNTGDPAVYRLVVEENLPPGLEYISGSTQWRKSGGTWNPGGDPQISGDLLSGYTLTWTEAEIAGLEELRSRNTLEIEFQIRALCPFEGGTFQVNVGYLNVCAEPGAPAVGSFVVLARRPSISVSKTQITPTGPIDCGGTVTWEIRVTNDGDAIADYVWVEDILGDGLTYVSSEGDGIYAVDDGVNVGSLVTWALEDLPPGATAILRLTAEDNGSCGSLDNLVRVWWGCGDDLDGSSATNDSVCLWDFPAEEVAAGTRIPVVSLSASLEPTRIPACGEATLTITLQNNSTATARAIDAQITLPTGLSYVLGSTEVDCGWGFSSAPDPQIVGQTLVWYDENNNLDNLCDQIPPGGVVRLRFRVQASCYTSSQNASIRVWYFDCCEEWQQYRDGSHTLQPAWPNITVTKTPGSVPLDCHDPSDTVTWTIRVTNTGTAQADWVRVEDTLGASLVYVGSDPPATAMGPQKWGWEFGPLEPGEFVDLALTASLERPQENCSAALRTNTASVYWGCGNFDGDPNTVEGCQLGGPKNVTALVTIPDLYIAPSGIAPVLTCSSDGNYFGSVRLTVRNNGDAPITQDFQITLSEANTGWTVSGYFSGDFGGTLPINPNSTRTITIPGWPVSCGMCEYEFTARLDANDDICECRENNNANSRTWTIAIPDLTVRSQALSVTCAGDGQVRISGTVTLGNEGCGGNLTADVPMRFVLLDGVGCLGTPLYTWTEVFTGVDIPAGGEQAFPVSRTFSLDLCTQASGCTVSLLIEADYSGSICECDGGNNTLCVDFSWDIPDLTVRGEDLSLSCAGDGQVRISGTVTLGNEGCGGNLTADVPMRFVLLDGVGCLGTPLYTWTEVFTGVDIPAGGEQAFPVSRTFSLDLCTQASGCTVSLLIEADYSGSICECDGGNNTLCVDFSWDIPDLAVVGVEPDVPDACSPGTVMVTVNNAGCVASPAGILVRISGDATGEAALPAILAAGMTVIPVFLNEILPCGNYALTVTVDPDDSLCECSAGNNAVSVPFVVVDPDLVVEDLTISCNPKGTATVSFTVQNLGTEASPETTVRLYIDGDLAYTWSVPGLGIGEAAELSWETPPLKCGEVHNFRVVVDEEGVICECNEGNNEASASWTCPCPALVTGKQIAGIQRGGLPIPPGTPIQAGDVIRYRLGVTNVGGANAYNVDIFDTLPVEFLYISGSTSATWPRGSYNFDPDGAPGPDLFWDISAELAPNETLTLEFQAVVTSAVVQGQTYTNTMGTTGEEGEGTPIPPDMSGSIPEDTDPDDRDSVSHPAAAVPALSVDKAIVDVLRNGVSVWPVDRVEPGDLVHYRFTIRNVGEGTAYDVDFTDKLPLGLEYDTDYADGTYTVDDPPSTGSLGIPDGATGTLEANISATIAGGGTLVADFYAYVTSSVRQGVDLVNTATATGVDGYGTPIPPENVQIGDTSDDDPDDPDPDDSGLARIGVAEPALALDKEIVDVLRGGVSIWPTPIVLRGDVIVYRVTVRNVGLGTAYNVDFTDELPFGTAYDASGDGAYIVDNPPATGSLGIPDGAIGLITADISATVAGGGTLVVTYWVRVLPEAVPGSWLENQAIVTGQDGAGTPIPEFNPDPSDSYPDTDSTTIRVGAPALVTKKAYYCPGCDPCNPEPAACNPCATEPIPVVVGDIVRFQLVVINVGYSTAYDIAVEDWLPKGFEYVKESAILTWPGGEMQLEPVVADGTLTWITGVSLDAGARLDLVFSARVTGEAPVGEEVVNVMRAEGVDESHLPIPPDSRMYVPEDTDPEDRALLRLQVTPAPGAARPGRTAGLALLGLGGLGGILGGLRRTRFLGLALLFLAGVGFLAHPQPPGYTVTLLVDPPGAGTAFGAGTYEAGELVQVSALPNPGFEFVGWFEEGEETSKSPFLDFPAERDRLLVARFHPVFELVGLSWQSQGRVALLPTPGLESARFEVRPRFRFGQNPWDFRAVAAFAGANWTDAQFHFTGAWDQARFGGGLLLNPSGPAYRSAYALLSLPMGGLRLGLRGTHYPSYGTPPGPALLSHLTLTSPALNFTVRFEEKAAVRLKEVTLSLVDLELCCGLKLLVTLTWTKTGFSHARFSARNIPLWCCGLSADLAVTFAVNEKSVEFTPRWSYCEACLQVYGDVLWDASANRLGGLALYGYRIRCCFGPTCCPGGPGGFVEFLTAFDPQRVPGGFRGEEFEYLKLAFCGPSCCGGTYKAELTLFFQPTGGLFGFSRLLAAGTLPLLPGFSLEPKLEISVGGDVAVSLGWTWR
ncbi:MAG: CARDB domain-containing protein [Candidatus Bipolaricaulaceae bacterium]